MSQTEGGERERERERGLARATMAVTVASLFPLLLAQPRLITRVVSASTNLLAAASLSLSPLSPGLVFLKYALLQLCLLADSSDRKEVR